MTETVLEEMNLKIIINKNTITIKGENNKILYTHIGRFIYKTLDETNFAIIEKDKPEPNALKKGYTLTYVEDKLIKNIKDVKIDDTIKIRLSDGFIISKVINKE